MVDSNSKIRVGAVSYLNTVPLVWGMLHGHERSSVDLSFSIPSICAEQVENGTVDIGLVPVAEIARQGLTVASNVGIAARGAVRSILLFSRKPFSQIKTLAADLSSRTSVQLARVILRERYGAIPAIQTEEPNLEQMLATYDAALVIGDPALRIDPDTIGFECLDLSAEWQLLTGLPMVFAAWAGHRGGNLRRLQELTAASYRFGKSRLPDIVKSEFLRRGISQSLATQYLSSYIQYELGPDEMKGLELFLDLAGLASPLVLSGTV